MTRTNPKPATCDKCNSTDVSWFKSKKSGKFYLCEVFTDSEGDRISSHRDFHSKYCGDRSKHDYEQERILGNEEKRQGIPQHDTLMDEKTQQRALDISDLPIFDAVLAIADLTREEPSLALRVRNLWKLQGENTLAEILEGAAGLSKSDD